MPTSVSERRIDPFDDRTELSADQGRVGTNFKLPGHGSFG